MNYFCRAAREARDKHIEQLFVNTNERPPPSDLPFLEVKLPDASSDAFEMVLNYIYTDRIDPTEKSKSNL